MCSCPVWSSVLSAAHKLDPTASPKCTMGVYCTHSCWQVRKRMFARVCLSWVENLRRGKDVAMNIVIASTAMRPSVALTIPSCLHVRHLVILPTVFKAYSSIKCGKVTSERLILGHLWTCTFDWLLQILIHWLLCCHCWYTVTLLVRGD